MPVDALSLVRHSTNFYSEEKPRNSIDLLFHETHSLEQHTKIRITLAAVNYVLYGPHFGHGKKRLAIPLYGPSPWSFFQSSPDSLAFS